MYAGLAQVAPFVRFRGFRWESGDPSYPRLRFEDMDYPFLAVILLIVGFTLIVAEVFLPSGGMIMIMCVVTMMASFWCAYKAWYGVNSLAFSAYLASMVVLIPTVVIGAFKVFPMTPFGRAVIGSPTLAEVTPYAREQQHLQSLVGHRGRAITPLIPGGMVMVNGERLHAFTEGLLVEAQTEIEIVDVRGNRVVVREATGPAPQGPSSRELDDPLLTDESTDGPDESPLDFTLPHG